MMSDKPALSCAYFENRACQYFPCHESGGAGFFNCLFCYCPLYALGEGCGGCFNYTKNGIKDCSGCFLPHSKTGYAYVMRHIGRIAELMRETEDK